MRWKDGLIMGLITLLMSTCLGAQQPIYTRELVIGGGPTDTDGGASLNSDGSAEFSGPVEAGSMTLDAPLGEESGGTGVDSLVDLYTSLGLGTIATQDSDDVSLTGGSISGITEFATTDSSIYLGDPAAANNVVETPTPSTPGASGAAFAFKGPNGANNTGNGGNGGSAVFFGGIGGSSTSSGNGGNGGHIFIIPGLAGNGAGGGSNGTNANVSICYHPMAGVVGGLVIGGDPTSLSAGKLVDIKGGAKAESLELTDPLPLTSGGFGGDTAADARDALDLVPGTDVQAYDAQLADISGITPAAGGFVTSTASNLSLSTPAQARTALEVGTNFTAFASGTPYTLTTSFAAVDFGTTDPTITLTKAGTYLIMARSESSYAIATTSANNTVTTELYRTNNTPGALTNGSVLATGDAETAKTHTLADQSWQVVYTTANTDDAITLYAKVSVAPSSGSMWINAASIVAILLY